MLAMFGFYMTFSARDALFFKALGGFNDFLKNPFCEPFNVLDMMERRTTGVF